MTSVPSLFDRAARVAPGGVHSPVRAFKSVGGKPVFFACGEGAELIDVDGRRYIDFCQSFGPLILGHADRDAARAAHQAIDDGWSFGACEPYSLALAEWIVQRVPWVERIRFVSSGTEAVMSAIRVARAATKRPAILKFEGCYHGHADAMLVQAGSGLADGRVAASSAGVTDSTLADTVVAPLDDDEALDRVFAAHGARIAAAIIEPLPANYGLLPQRKEWLIGLADRCRRAGALLILDEVISGFRIGLQGMAGALGIRPDLVTYGKVIGGGFPVGAYAGRGDLMDLVAPVGPVYQAGTLSANPVGMRVGLATLSKVESANGWAELERRTAAFCSDLARRIPADADLEIERRASIFWIRKSSPVPVRSLATLPGNQSAWYAKFFNAALQRGVYLPPAAFEVCFVSMAHDDRVLAKAADALVAAAEDADGGRVFRPGEGNRP
jgi:glutamate-1-semialdehyde 2,1-aminomutase